MRPRLCSLLGVAIELPELPLSFGAAIRRMGSFVLVALAHSMQSPFASGVSALRACEWNSCASLSNSSLRDMVALLTYFLAHARRKMRLPILLFPVVPPSPGGPGRLVYHSAEAVAKLSIKNIFAAVRALTH